MPTISFINQKGGVAKTTSAVNVATALAVYHDKKVLLIDLDEQSHACISFGYQAGTVNKFRIGHLLERIEEGNTKDLPFQEALLEVSVPNLSLLPGQKKINRYFDSEDRTLLKYLIDNIPQYDWIIMDCPPARNVVTENAIVASDWAIVPCEQSVYSVEGFGDFLRSIEVILGEAGRSTKDFFKILLTKVDAREKISAQILAESLQGYETHILPHPIRKNDSLNQAPATRQSIFYYDSNSRGAHDYYQLSKYIVEYEQKNQSETTDTSAAGEEAGV